MTPDGPGYAARSDVGLQRTGNEDRFLAMPPLFAVADGMGGHQAGEVASGLAIRLLEQTASQTPSPGAGDLVDTLERSNMAIREEARLRSDLAGMGTTCTVVVIDTGVHIAHVGDSRAYRFRDGQLVQLTDDHSLVASMVREGIIAPADAMTDGRRNIITRALGAEDQVRVDLVSADRVAGDRLLLCSDGLYGQVGDTEIAAVLQEEDPGRAADRLIDLANAAGGDDNVTVIVIDPDGLVGSADGSAEDAAADVAEAPDPIAEDPIAEAAPPQASRVEHAPRRRKIRPLVVLVLLVLTAVVVGVGGWLLAGTTIRV